MTETTPTVRPYASPTTPRAGKAAIITGWILGALAGLALIMGGITDVLKSEMAVEGLAHAGYPPNVIVPLGWAVIGCAVLYLIPRTAVLGAIFCTGYLGGAVATHVRLGDPVSHIIPAFVFAFILWIALLLRDARLRELLPLRTKA